jgi:hypothetical protein
VLSVGAVAANTFQIYRFEAARSYWLLAPALGLRQPPGDGNLAGSAAFGVVAWSCKPGPCDDEGERGRTTFGGELSLGYTTGADLLVAGAHLRLAIVGPHVSSGQANVMLTFNVDLGLAFGGSSGAKSPRHGSPPRPAAGKRRR